jgi:hypothetical protein
MPDNIPPDAQVTRTSMEYSLPRASAIAALLFGALVLLRPGMALLLLFIWFTT